MRNGPFVALSTSFCVTLTTDPLEGKKGCECRFNLPMMIWPQTSIEFDLTKKMKWFHIDGSITERYPFQVITKRLQGDQFLNVHNTIASYLFSCNTNIQIGEVDHMYYNTLYGSKSTQKEDTRSFMNVSNALSRRITNQIDKNKENISKVNDNRRQEDGHDFIEGLCCLLSGVTANLSSSVVSAPLGHVLMIKGSRFQFSHEFSPLLLTQIKDVLEGKEHVSYYLRKGYNDKGEQITWPEMFANNYI